jgi:hypothetical protein
MPRVRDSHDDRLWNFRRPGDGPVASPHGSASSCSPIPARWLEQGERKLKWLPRTKAAKKVRDDVLGTIIRTLHKEESAVFPNRRSSGGIAPNAPCLQLRAADAPLSPPSSLGPTCVTISNKHRFCQRQNAKQRGKLDVRVLLGDWKHSTGAASGLCCRWREWLRCCRARYC